MCEQDDAACTWLLISRSKTLPIIIHENVVGLKFILPKIYIIYMKY